jgi:hypothetical protein
MACFYTIQSNSFAQSSSLKSSTISSTGTNISKTTTDLFIQQSIGQSSVIGSFKSEKMYFSQGFLTGISKNKSSSNKSISVLAFPNSFVNEINFRFFPEYNKEVAMSIFDMSGKIVYKNKITPINSAVEINLEKLSSGLYIVFFNFGTRLLQSRIIKL